MSDTDSMASDGPESSLPKVEYAPVTRDHPLVSWVLETVELADTGCNERDLLKAVDDNDNNQSLSHFCNVGGSLIVGVGAFGGTVRQVRITTDASSLKGADYTVTFTQRTNTPIDFSAQGDALSNMNLVLTEFFSPLLDPSKQNVSKKEINGSRDGGVGEGKGNTMSSSNNIKQVEGSLEFRSQLSKFSYTVANAVQHVSGRGNLTIPDIDPSTIIDPNHEDNHAVRQLLEESLQNWISVLDDVLTKEQSHKAEAGGPLNEISFWRSRNATLVKALVKLMQTMELPDLNAFSELQSNLSILFVEAKDNVKFLGTLERHFKNLTTGNLHQVLETIPSMMNAIRMVWIISRHYNTDERMVPLMGRVASKIADRVETILSIDCIFKLPPVEMKSAIKDAKAVLDSWLETYLKVRDIIEKSGTDHRWEFDKRVLFDRTKYMSKICSDLAIVGDTLDEFRCFLGPQLKEVTGNSQRVDSLLHRVDGLLIPLETTHFDVFDVKFDDPWQTLMTGFRAKVKVIEEHTNTFIDEAFRELRSVEGAFELLQNFQSIKSRESINNQMMLKFDDILVQYTKELTKAETLFDSQRDDPPLYKGYPPVAGSIEWATTIFNSIKGPIIQFRTMDGLLDRELGVKAKAKYLTIAKRIDEYIHTSYDAWKEDVQSFATADLCLSVLGPALGANGKLPPEPWYVNFSDRLLSLIKEAKILDKLGFEIPSAALHVALQEKTYTSYIEGLNEVLKSYHNILKELSPIQKELLVQQLDDLRQVLKQGFEPLNWNSLHIPQLIANATDKIDMFRLMVTQVEGQRHLIVEILKGISTTALISPDDLPSSALMPDTNSANKLDVVDLVQILESKMESRVASHALKYSEIAKLITKVEELVASTNTMMSPLLSSYYVYWEKRIYNAIATMVLRGLLQYQAMLNISSTGKSLFPPLCAIRTALNPPAIVPTPSHAEIHKLLSRLLKKIVNSSRNFPRWMDGTCRACEEQMPLDNDDGDVWQPSYYDDISMSSEIRNQMVSMESAIAQCFEDATVYENTWQQFDKKFDLFKLKKHTQLLAALENNGEDPSDFIGYLDKFKAACAMIKEEPTKRVINFIQIDSSRVSRDLFDRAVHLQRDIGSVLWVKAKAKLSALEQTIEHFYSQLRIDVSSGELNVVSQLLSDITSVIEQTNNRELEIVLLQDQYALLKTYGFTLARPDEYRRVESLQKTWKDLVVVSMTKDLRMKTLKKNFRAKTTVETAEFLKSCSEMSEDFSYKGPATDGIELAEGVAAMAKYTEIVAAKKRELARLLNAQKLFGVPLQTSDHLNKVISQMDKVKAVYDMLTEQKDFELEMSATSWAAFNVEVLEEGASKISKKFKKFPKALKNLSIYRSIGDVIENFAASIPLIQALKNEAMQPRHWDALQEATNTKFDASSASFTLQNIFDMDLSKFGEEIAEIVQTAMQELKIEKELRKVEKIWAALEFAMVKYNKGTEFRGMILRPADEILLELEDNMLNLQSMSASRFVVIFVDTVRKWEKNLNDVGDCIEIWYKVQAKWMYLESIFIGSEDIRRQLPAEAKAFDVVDKKWKTIMNVTMKDLNVLNSCTAEGRIDDLNALSDALDACQKGLSEYLMTKRNAFPRFFFISDDELLSVLGSSDPTNIQVHLMKLFMNCANLKFMRGDRVVGGMSSSEKEAYDFRTLTPVEGPVEQWMTAVNSEMHASLYEISREGVFHYAKTERLKWIAEQLGMVTVLGSQIWWTWETEDVFQRVLDGDKYAMKDFESKLTDQLMAMVREVRKPISRNNRKKLNCLLIVDVHSRDIIATFVRDSILDAREFAWESQLRFYWDKSIDDVSIQQCTGDFSYGYEYGGLSGRLVITPLTDRCYMTITQALTFKLGCSPAGPAGTGKTETVKDLAKGMALPCYVTCCGEGLDFRAMGSIFAGLCQIGAWGCFDEFNRINIEVISVVSAQLRALQNALNYNKKTVDIGIGYELAMHPSVAICITMNPGYAGRTELPDSIKALFRPVTMVRPDLLQICEMMLFAEGFEMARVLAKKMTTLYSLGEGQLSKQYHYDFGMRALKSVLVMAGKLKREYSEMAEDLVLMRALRDMNKPKFVFEDVPLFRALIEDLFPGLDCARVGYPDLNAAGSKYLEERGYHHSNEETYNVQIDKAIQIYETLLTRHTLIIVGPTGGGKTLAINGCAASMEGAFGDKVKQFRINPKAQSVTTLYGFMDPATREWTDGMLSNIFRKINQPLPPGKKTEKRWLIFDGDVDALWIENMNSVMDDNKCLTLPNSERIRLLDHSKLFVECFDLQYASPATISRCGCVWVDPKDIGFQPYFERWVKLRSDSVGTDVARRLPDGDELEMPAENEKLQGLYDKYIPKSISFILDGVIGEDVTDPCKQVIPVTGLNMVRQFASLFDAIVPPNLLSGSTAIDDTSMESCFIFCIIWGIGGALVESSRMRFNEFFRGICNHSLPGGNIYDSFFSLEEKRWMNWSTQVKPYEEPVPFQFSRIMVPTTDSFIYTQMLIYAKQMRKPVLLVGRSGTAKTVTVQNYQRSLDPSKEMLLGINFSSRTADTDVYASIDSSTDKRTAKIFGPPPGTSLNVFIDDMNMPKVDIYGTQRPIAFLLFLIGHGNMYSREKDLDLRQLKDLTWTCAMGPPGGGRNPVDPRFTALFNVFNIKPPAEAVLKTIFSSIITTFFEKRNFPKQVLSAVSSVTDATLQLYNALTQALPPTPSKFHYIFNLRDLSRIYEGLSNSTIETVTSEKDVARLWRHETMRVFRDRLTDEKDQGIFDAKVKDLISSAYASSAEYALKDPSVYGDFENAVERLSEDAEDTMLYREMAEGGYSRPRKIFDEILELYNADHKEMNLVLFESALEHLARIYRILRTPLGNALLVGVGGSGKQSLTKLGTFAAGYKLFEITLCRGYGEKEFREELKVLYTELGTSPVTFLFTDAHVVEEGFLELINNMLTTGMVPALYESDERDVLITSVRKEVKAAGIFDTDENCWKYYIAKCRKNLHIVLAMSPSGSSLRVRCRNFPGLVSAAVIDWYFPWPKLALQKVASHFLKETKLPTKLRGTIIDHIVMVHSGVISYAERYMNELRRPYYVTPKNYLDYIANYQTQLEENKLKVKRADRRLEGGLSKLLQAGRDVERMQQKLIKAKAIVDDKTVKCEALIKSIGEKQVVAGAQQEVAQKKQVEIEAASKIIATEKAKADSALEEAIPALEAAAEALDNLRKEDITEIKAFASPPKAVMNVCMCVLHLKPYSGPKFESGWSGCKKMLGDMNFLNSLKTYNKDGIKEKQVKSVDKILRVMGKSPELALEAMSSISKAGFGLLSWVVAIVKYHGVAKNVEPLRIKVKKMQKESAAAQKELAAIEKTLAKLTAEIDELEAGFKKSNGELVDLKEKADIMEAKLIAAQKLISGLGGERTRWTEERSKLAKQDENVTGDALLAASFLSYTGAFTMMYRQEMIKAWQTDIIEVRKVPMTDPFELKNILTTDATIQLWISEGLPADSNSVRNGILTTRASRFPLCIDPQQQAVVWIKEKESKNNLVVKTFNDGDFVRNLELAVQYGKPYLFEDVYEEIDPVIDPILEKLTYVENNQVMVKLGDSAVPWDDGFRLYMTSKLSNPHYTPEVMGKTMIINYAVTIKGLENQLLNVVVGHERPDLEEQHRNIVLTLSENARLLIKLEDSLLQNLANSEGDILEDVELIATLEETKAKSVEIAAKIEQATFTSKEINVTRLSYTPAAKRASILFFAMAGLANIMKMYECSLASYLVVFRGALTNSPKDAMLEARLDNIIKASTEDVYDYVCMGIFERHKLMFSFQMTCMILEGNDQLNRQELTYFLKGNTALEEPDEQKPYDWISDSCWKDLSAVTECNDIFESLVPDLKLKGSEWKSWYDKESPETETLPMGYSEKLNSFQQLIVYRCFRPDRAFNGCKMYVVEQMGEKFVQPPVIDYENIFKQSTPLTPVVFILSPGADPQGDIQTLASKKGMTGQRFKYLALGQGQGPLAMAMMKTGAARGNWVLLLNCHLLLSWMGELEGYLQGLKKAHDDFRLWLTTDPTDKFPLGIVQRALKVVTEPPDGLKLNMRSTIYKVDQEIFDSCPHDAFRPLVFSVTFLHAVVLERRKYGKIGWNVPYDFSESDFIISRRLLALYLEKAIVNGDETMPWGSLKYLIGDAMYGGRVADNYDRRVLQTYMHEYFGDFLFDKTKPFFFSQVGFDYKLPKDGKVEVYHNAVEELPLVNSPAVFGLHPNAEIQFFVNAIKNMWGDLINLQPRTAGGGGGISREGFIDVTASNIMNRIPEVFDLNGMKKMFGTPMPSQIVLLQEVERWNILVEKISDCLIDLRRALKGEIGMSDKLDALGDSLFNGFVPDIFRRLCPKTEKPLGAWMTHFDRRYAQYADWIENGLPAVIWLSGLHIPESFLAAIVQTTCRAKNWPLDKSIMYTNVTVFKEISEVETAMENGIYIIGLYLEGAKWDSERMCLARQEPKVLVVELPILQAIPIESSKLKLQNTFKTPVYVTQDRRNAMGVGLVFTADLGSLDHASHWTLQGVALVLNIDS